MSVGMFLSYDMVVAMQRNNMSVDTKKKPLRSRSRKIIKMADKARPIMYVYPSITPPSLFRQLFRFRNAFVLIAVLQNQRFLVVEGCRFSV